MVESKVMISFVSSEKRSIPYMDNIMIISREGQYGHWKLYLERGETPQALKEVSFTTIDDAVRAVTNHINSKNYKKVK
jgi:hypothetical protein